MKRKNACLTGIVFAAVCFAAAANDRDVPDSVAGGGNNYNVWPTGDPAVDVANVQWAIENVRSGGVVRLKGHDKFTGVPAAFEFGVDGSVIVTRDVAIKGEIDDGGNPLATIHGGLKPITCNDPSVAFEISNLRFDGATRAAIYVRQSAAAEISGNVIVNVLPLKAVGYPIPGASYFAASGIEMGLLACETYNAASPSRCLDPPMQLGSVEISGNFIDLGIRGESGELLDPTQVYPNGTLQDTSFSGIVIVDAELTATISANTILNTNRRAIHPLDTFGSTLTTGNTIQLAPFSSAAPGAASAGGSGKRNFAYIAINGHRNVDAATRGAVHKVTGNTVIVASDSGADGPHGQGIVATNGVNGLVFTDNTIVYGPGARNALAVGGNSSLVKNMRPRFATIAHNTIDAASPLPPPIPPAVFTPTHIAVGTSDSTTIDGNTYKGELPAIVILGSGTGVVDDAHPNTVVDSLCGETPNRIVFANLASCTKP